MNLPPAWVGFLNQHGIEAIHWSTVGNPRAPDAAIMEWARNNGCVVFTHDLDFSALLAATAARGPSVIQVRTQNVLPTAIGDHVVQVLQAHAAEIDRGAIITIDRAAARVRILPIHDEPRR